MKRSDVVGALVRPLWRVLRSREGLSVVGLVVVSLGLLATTGHSGPVPVPDRAACCTGATALGDAMIHTPTGGDKDFFETTAGPPSTIFLIGNNESMQEYPVYLPEAGDPTRTGCSDPALVAAMSWFDASSPDPKRNGSEPIDPDPEFSSAGVQFFEPNRFYHSRGWRLARDGTEWPFSLNADFRGTVSADADQICLPYSGWSSSSATFRECRSCLLTRGWWRGPIGSDPHDAKLPTEARRRWLLSGRVLNVRPPKFVAARKVLKDVVMGTTNLRMGLATFGVDRGWYDPPMLLHPMQPSCSRSHPLFDEKELKRADMVRAINTLSFRNPERSIGEALFGLGGYYSSQQVDGRWVSWFRNPINPGWGWPGGWNGGTDRDPITLMDGAGWGQAHDEWHKPGQPWEGSGDQKSMCFGCQASSVIVLTDGAPRFDNTVPITKMMELLVANKAAHPDGTPLTFDASNPRTNTNPGGVNYCDRFGVTKEACDYANWPTGHARTNRNFMDDVAFFLANTDLRGDLEGQQSVTTYTIGYGDNSPMLQSIAMAGKGRFYRVDDPAQLRDALLAAIGEVKQVSTAFSSTNVSGVQASGQSSVYVPRFVPRRGMPYEGHLYRFFFFNEFTQGCDPVQARSTRGDRRDLNGDKDCEDTFFLDKPAGFNVTPGTLPSPESFSVNNIVQENADGQWVKVRTASTNSEGRLVGGQPAEPFWNLAETLGRRSASAPCNRDNPLDPTSGRCLFTLVDQNQDGRFTAEDNPPVPFEESQLATLKPYVLAAGDGFCLSLFAKRKLPWAGTREQQDECVRSLIRFVRGMDVLDYDGDANTAEDRPCAEDLSRSCKLADIFHSTPVLVDPPIEPFLCSLGLSGQCLSTLYEDFTASVSSEATCSTQGAGKPCYTPTPMAPPPGAAGERYGAYDVFRKAHAKRERIVLVGSNGGMLHAVHAGASTDRNKTNVIDDVYDLGTGQELWAFIPPDLLPKLGLMMNGHEFYVDGTPMVRDIWADGSTPHRSNGVKEPGEFHTLAILSERSGGQRFTALDVTNPREMLDPSGKPFRWMFPNACDPESSTVGQSWSSFAPKPPPIGPVRLAADNARGWEERWIVFLNGGYSADLTRGRGVYMLDAWTGQKLWSVEARPGASGSSYQEDLVNRMMPVVASPAMVDMGRAEDIRMDQDGFFDTMVVGDLGGQVWTFRFHQPGVLGANGQVDNWFAARSLEVQRGQEAFKKTPFFHIASNVRQPDTGWLRSYLGTGDRQNLRDKEDTACSPDNLLACVRQRCDVRAELVANINGHLRTTRLEYDDGVLVKNLETTSGTPQPACSATRMELTGLTINCPNGTALGGGTYRYPLEGTAVTDAECAVSGGQWSCSLGRLSTDSRADLRLGSDAQLIPKNRYYGFHSYGGPQRRFRTEAEALVFDQRRVTDIPFTCEGGVPCSLVDVTIPESAYATGSHPKLGTVRYVPDSKLGTLARGTAEGPGWFLEYGSLQEKTAAGSAVLGGIVFWPSFQPPEGASLQACKLMGGGDTSRSWQADVITGLPDQAQGFRFQDDTDRLLGFIPHKTRPASAPPSEPASLVALSKTGGIRYQVAMADTGAPPSTETLRERSNVAPDISWLVVPRNLHECRHVDSRLCQ
jgi:type IV pilus assembly protein PilY1